MSGHVNSTLADFSSQIHVIPSRGIRRPLKVAERRTGCIALFTSVSDSFSYITEDA